MASLLSARANFLARARVEWWAFRAGTAHRSGDSTRAEELLARCVALSEAIGDEHLQAEFLVYQANVLFEQGRIKDSLAVAAPLLPNGRLRGGADQTFHALVLWIEGALALTVSAPAIERVLAMLENYVDASGHPEWRCVQFRMRALLLLEQDRLAEALAVAQEGWQLWQRHRRDTVYSEGLLAFDIAYLARNLMRADDVHRLLADLARIPVVDSEERQSLVYDCEYSIAMVEGRHQDAVRAKERIATILRHRSNSAVKQEQLLQLAEARATAQHVEQAGFDLVRLARMRHSSLTGTAYAYREVIGDVHLAAARRAAKLPTIDPDIPVSGEVGPPDGADPLDLAAEVRRARLAYRAARPFADRLDTAFECTRNRERLNRRLRLLDEL